MKQRFMSIALIVAAAAFVAAGCGSDDGGSTTETGGNKDFDGNMTIGVIVPLTGQLADFGEAGSNAAKLAGEQINDAASEAGLEGTVTISEEDGETSEQAGTQAATKLQGDGASCIAGDWASASTKAIAESVTVPDEVPLISPASTSPELTTLEDDGLLFRTVPSDALQGALLGDAIAEDLGGSGTVAVGARNDAYGSALAEEFKKAAEEAGLTVNDPVLYNPEGAQFDTEAEKLVDGDPDAFVIIDFPENYQKLGPALARTGSWDPTKTWTADGLRTTSLPKDAGAETTEGMRGTAPTAEEAPAGDAFDTLWTANKDFGDRQTYDAQNFDAVVLCYLAAVKAGGTDGADMADALTEVSGPPGTKYTFEDLAEAIEALQNGEDVDYEGASGPIDFDENGDTSAANYEVWQYTKGAIETLQVIPFDEEGAGDPIGDTATTADTSAETTA